MGELGINVITLVILAIFVWLSVKVLLKIDKLMIAKFGKRTLAYLLASFAFWALFFWGAFSLAPYIPF